MKYRNGLGASISIQSSCFFHSFTFVLHFGIPYFIKSSVYFPSLLFLLVCRDLLPSYPHLRLVSSILLWFYLSFFSPFTIHTAIQIIHTSLVIIENKTILTIYGGLSFGMTEMRTFVLYLTDTHECYN